MSITHLQTEVFEKERKKKKDKTENIKRNKSNKSQRSEQKSRYLQFVWAFQGAFSF